MNNKLPQQLNDLLIRIDEDLLWIKEKFPTKKIGFMLGSTVSHDNREIAYKTPVRVYDDLVIFGAIVFNQIDAIVLVNHIESRVDKVFVDAEKKLPIDFNPDFELLELFGISYNEKKGPELGNLSAAVRKFINPDKLLTYKANDLIVDSIWNFVSMFLGELSGKKILILGLGNIGCKLTQKFVESGVSVQVVGRNYVRDGLLVNSINEMKTKGTLAAAVLVRNLEYALIDADAVLLATSSQGIFNEKMMKLLKHDTLVVDIGKGNVTENGLTCAIERGIPVWRADITDTLPLMLSQILQLKFSTYEKFGRKVTEDFCMVSGGMVGKKYDLVVDNFRKPTKIIGVCDGEGGFVEESDPNYKKLIKLFEKSLFG